MGEFRVRITLGRRPCALLLGIGVALFAWLSGNSSVFPPELWDEISIAAGIRPPVGPTPGFWRFAVSRLIAYAGLERTIFVLRVLGPVSLGLLASFMYLFLSEMLPLSLRQRMMKWGWSRRVVQLVLIQGALCFVLSDPVWRLGRVFAPDMLLLLVGVLLLDVFCWAMRGGKPFLAILMSGIAGLFAADTVFAFVLLPTFSAFVSRRLNSPGVKMNDALSNPLLRYLTFRRMFVMFSLMWIVGVWLNTQYFWANGGLAAQGWTQFTYFLHYLFGYLQEIGAAARPLGWVFITIAAVAPLVIAIAFVGVATDDDKLLSYLVGLVFLAIGLFAFTQSTGWTSAWFWHWIDTPEQVPSQFLLCFCMFMTSVVVTMSLCVVGVEFYFRSDSRVAGVRFEDAVESAKNWARVVASLRKVGRVVRAGLAYEPLVVLALLVVPRFSTVEREMSALVNDSIWQTAEECGSAGLIFTDGMLDSALEVAARRQGRDLKALSMLAGTTPYEKYVRTRGETDEEDEEMLEAGAANTLRTWVKEGDARASDIAVQVGLELWRRNGLKVPEYGGLVARTAGFPEGERGKWVSSAHRLAGRALALHREEAVDDVPNARLKDMLSVVEWRLSRMCQMRADAEDSAGNADDALHETELAEVLDNVNVAWKRVRERMEWTEVMYDTRFTPREGMRHWLEKGDFRMARMYARRILNAKPQDSSANFAVGMSYFVEEKYNRAEAYLKRSLESRPDEPAALNNLAVVQAKLGRLEEAETNALKALKRLPDSTEINSTLRAIRRRLGVPAEAPGVQIGKKEKGGAEG